MPHMSEGKRTVNTSQIFRHSQGTLIYLVINFLAWIFAHLNVRIVKINSNRRQLKFFFIFKLIFQPHLIRHIGRKHPHEGREKVDEVLESAENKKTRANKISKPSTSQSALCKDLIERHLCIKCGHIFTERHDLMKHVRVSFHFFF